MSKTTNHVDRMSIEKILFDQQNDSFKYFNQFTKKLISGNDCVEGMVKSREEAQQAIAEVIEYIINVNDKPEDEWVVLQHMQKMRLKEVLGEKGS